MLTASRSTNTVLMLAMVGGVGLPAVAQEDPYDDLPDSIVLQGTVRDFRDRNHEAGHDDFQWRPKDEFGKGRFGHYIDMVADELDDDGKPVFASGGRYVATEWRDADGNRIMQPRPYIEERSGDQAGSAQGEGTSAHDAAGFAQWFRDVSGLNASSALPITLRREPGTDKYVFDDKEDALFMQEGGFFPINGELLGDYADSGKNFHFTYELSTEFTYREDGEQIFRFIGDDDVWVFIDGKLVIDLGGVHGAIDQTIDLTRLNWLVDGERYSLHFFFAERHTTQSNFRIETNLLLRDINIPTVSALYD